MPGSSKGSYNRPPSYEDTTRRSPLGGTGQPNLPPGYVPPPDNGPGTTMAAPAPAPASGNLPVGQSATPGGTPVQVQPVTNTPQPYAPPQPFQGYNDALGSYIQNTMFGQGRSFDPLAQQITGQRDDALRAMAERMASRGMGNSGALGMGAGDIYNQAGNDLASAYQNWRAQGVQEMAPFIEGSMAERLLGASTNAKEQLLNAQTEAQRRMMFGDNYDPNQGTYGAELAAMLAGKGEPGSEMEAWLENYLKQTPGVRESFGGTSDDSGYDKLDELNDSLSWVGWKIPYDWAKTHGMVK